MDSLKLDTSLYFSSVNFNGYQNDFWQETWQETSPGGRFYIDLGRRFNPNRFVTRNQSIWTLPWPQEIIPKFALVDYDPGFSQDFTEVSDRRALDFQRRIRENDEKFVVLYSGGIDSTAVLVALFKNLTQEELKNIAVSASTTSIMENPYFWRDHIQNRVQVIDSMVYKYDYLIESSYTPITADDGDCIHGTLFGINLYHNWEHLSRNLSDASKRYLLEIMTKFSDPGVHFSEYKDLLVSYFNYDANPAFPLVPVPEPDLDFGRKLYEKFRLNCDTAGVPIRSLHDFFWWLIFNVKMLNCAVRGPLYYNDRVNARMAIGSTENWYADVGYQKWSMVNNNNGTKIGRSAATYKQAVRDYIWDYDHNDWYRAFKLKLESMNQNTVRQTQDKTSPLGLANQRFGITKDYEMLNIDHPRVRDYIKHHLANYKIDWA